MVGNFLADLAKFASKTDGTQSLVIAWGLGVRYPTAYIQGVHI